MTNEFVSTVENYASVNKIPSVPFEKGQRKDDVAAYYHKQYEEAEGVVFIGVAQEKVNSFKAKKDEKGKAVRFDFTRQSVYVKVYYIYIQDAEFGPGFIKICHELGDEQVQAFFDKWVERLPWPLTHEERQAGFTHRLSIWQMEVSLTHVFNRPLRGREFFEQVMRDTLDLGRPDRMQLIFDRRMMRNTPSRFQTRVVQIGVQPSIHITYRHSGVKQYFKENRALRTETTINNPHDFDVTKDLSNWTYLRKLAASINRRLLETQPISQDCLLSAESFERISEPTTSQSGQRAPGLRFGQPRAMALFSALARFATSINGFRHADLRPIVLDLLPHDHYSASQMTYDLRRLRLKGLISRIHGSHRYILPSYGPRVAVLITKMHNRLFNPTAYALHRRHTVTSCLLDAFNKIDAEIDRLVSDAQFAPA